MVRTLHPTRRFVAVLTSAALTVTGLTLTGMVAVSAAPASASDSSMFNQVNSSRASRGLSAYDWNSHLTSVAREQAQRMAKKTKLYHNPNLASDVGNYRWVGENVGYGPNSSVIQKAFMDSPAHKANILDDNYTQIGIASVEDSKGRLWVAQVFRQPSGGGSSSTADSPAKKKNKKSESKPKAKAVAKKSSTPKATPKRTAKSTTTSSNATAPKPKPTATNRPTKSAEPTPELTLQQRVSYATAAEDSPKSNDPIADALAFAATMNAIGG